MTSSAPLPSRAYVFIDLRSHTEHVLPREHLLNFACAAREWGEANTFLFADLTLLTPLLGSVSDSARDSLAALVAKRPELPLRPRYAGVRNESDAWKSIESWLADSSLDLDEVLPPLFSVGASSRCSGAYINTRPDFLRALRDFIGITVAYSVAEGCDLTVIWASHGNYISIPGTTLSAIRGGGTGRSVPRQGRGPAAPGVRYGNRSSLWRPRRFAIRSGLPSCRDCSSGAMGQRSRFR